MKSLIITSLLLLLCACSTLKRSNSTASESTQYEHNKTYSYILEKDSSARVWHLNTDSPFYYHPERGLWAVAGQLWQQDLSERKRLQATHKDSLYFTEGSYQEKYVIREMWYDRLWMSILALCILIGGGFWLLKRKNFI